MSIPGSSTIALTEQFSKFDISEDQALKTSVQNGDIVINDGASDLSVSDSLRHINLETEYEDEDSGPGGNIDGGRPGEIYEPGQLIDGGGPNSF